MDALNARKIRILVSDSCTKATAKLWYLLPVLHIRAEVIHTNSLELERLLAEQPVDAVILGPENIDLAIEISGRTFTGVLLLVPPEEMEHLIPSCVSAGILLAAHMDTEAAFRQLMALCSRLRTLRLQTTALKRQLDDTRLVNRAKLLLMEHLKMSEGEAHRYIEKTAMDTGFKRRGVAESIIRTYEA